MEAYQKKSLFTAISEEESATVSGGDLVLVISPILGIIIPTSISNIGDFANLKLSDVVSAGRDAGVDTSQAALNDIQASLIVANNPI